jgi:hypothetical protein
MFEVRFIKVVFVFITVWLDMFKVLLIVVFKVLLIVT